MPHPRAVLELLRAAESCRVLYRVPWWGSSRNRFQGRLLIGRGTRSTRAHWLAFNPKDFRPVVDKLLVIDDGARILEFSRGARRVITNNSGTSLDYAHALEFAAFCLELKKRFHK